jgi:ABC-type microcin C transport system permease subunit YejE
LLPSAGSVQMIAGLEVQLLEQHHHETCDHVSTYLVNIEIFSVAYSQFLALLCIYSLHASSQMIHYLFDSLQNEYRFHLQQLSHSNVSTE